MIQGSINSLIQPSNMLNTSRLISPHHSPFNSLNYHFKKRQGCIKKTPIFYPYAAILKQSYSPTKIIKLLMNQNYNSLFSPSKNPTTLDFHSPGPKPPRKQPLFDSVPLKAEERVAKLNRQSLLKEIEVFSWRNRTSLPVLKIAHYSVYPLTHPLPSRPIFKTDSLLNSSPNKSKEEPQNSQKLTAYVSAHPEVAAYEVRAQTEEILSTLSEIEMLAIPQIILLLKETLIGFELLIDIFGVFQPTQRMILVNQRHQWRVWINEDYVSSTKATPKISEKQFIYTIIKFVEAHAPSTNQSKTLFNCLMEVTYHQDCSFIRVLQKVNEFAAVHKIFHVNKVVLNHQRVASRESNKFIPHFHPPEAADTLKNIKANLQKLTTSPLIDAKAPKKQGLVQFGANNRSTQNLFSENSLMHSPSYTNLQPHCKANISSSFAPLSPPVLSFNQRNDPKQSQFDKFCENWDSNKDSNINRGSLQTPAQSKYMARKHFTTGVDYSQVIYSPKANIQSQVRPSFHPNIKHYNHNPKQNTTIITPVEMKRTTMTNVSPAKNRKQMKQIFHQKPPIIEKPIIQVQSKPVSRLDEGPQKRNNKRKYSQQIIQIKSLDHASKKQKYGHISTICNPNDQIRTFNKLHEGVMVSTPTPKTDTKYLDSSPDVKGISSPNNSSSTKQIQQSGELKANYTKLKMKDLGGDKPKNNQSVINPYNMPHLKDPKKDKNMAVSYQFQNKEAEDDSSNSQRSLERVPNKKETKWSNKISGLFSDSVSIKHLKQSIRIKTKQEEHFEKEYLKDVKLDLLDKFGRKANIVQDDEGRLHAPYKSMQLIQEELEEGKSYLDEDMRFEEFPIKENRSKNHTMQVGPQGYQHEEKKAEARQCNSQYDDNDLSSQMASSSSPSSGNNGFEFQTEMYNISRPL